MRRVIYITIMAMAIMPYSGKIHVQIGGLVIEAMVGDHQ